ncbi:tetratricopeptide repeat protein [Herpetosiphon llansteffanensis]|uniref:tetratricopeptide repeat protein n=1 Tax=Herpetosiphon llansteffanensis TaxID=2094568 RepID=UPI000D7BCF35|nr:tetratricopeptide repeat protein [Herpetosiphon llansteffanensis]
MELPGVSAGTVNIQGSNASGSNTGVNHGTINNIFTTSPVTDPLPTALAALAAIPLDTVPAPRVDLSQTSRIPFESSSYFVGRESELKALARAIGNTQPTVVVPAVTTGLGGIGKTSLVTEFAYRYGVHFQGGVFWIDCSIADQVASQIAACALALQMNPTGLSLDDQVQRVMVAWQSPMPRLLIFDNCEDRTILDRWKPKFGGCRMLVTSRSDQWSAVTHVRLGLLETHESRSLLQTLYPRLTNQEADQIAADLGHLPLALHLAGSYLHSYPHQSVLQYRDDLTIAHRSLKGRGALPSPTQHELDVEATFMVSVKQLDPNTPIDSLALNMLDGAAWCAPSVPIPRDVILSFVPDGTDDDDAVDALRRLQILGLLDGIETVVLHRLLAQVIHSHMGWSTTLALVEQRMATAAEKAHKTGIPKQMNPLEPHLRDLTLRALARDTEQGAQLATNLGLFAQHQGRYAEAQTLHERALVVRKALVGENHPDTAMSMNNLAEALHEQGRYRDARELFERTLVVREALLGTEHPDTARSVNNLAGVLESQGRYAEAQELYEQALAVREAVLGTEHPDTATSVNNLAFVLQSQGRYAKAQELYERALAVREAVLGAEHPETASSLNNLAGVLDRQGRYAEAQELFERALAVREAMLGAEHPETASSLNNLAGVLDRQGRYAKAQELFERALTINEAVLGVDHPDTARSVNNLAVILSSQGRYAEAQELYEQALTVREAVLGTDHPETASSVNNLAGVLARQGRYGDAQRLYERALAVREAVLGAEHPDTAWSMNGLARVLASQGRYGDAQRLYERALVINKAVLGREHRDTIITMSNLASVLERQRQYGKAQSLYEQALAISKRVLDSNHPDMQSLQRDVGRVQRLYQNTKKKKRK